MKIGSRKLQWHSVNKFLRNIHIPFGLLVLVVLTIHFFITMDVWVTRNVMVIVTGITATVLMLLMAAGYAFRKRLGSKWIVLHRSGAILIALLIISHIALYYVDFFSYKSNISTIDIIGLDANNVKDGTYLGEYDAGYIYAKVEVVVRNGQIVDINILQHDNERGTPAETIVDSIIEQQYTKVDTVSGATNSSLVLEKSVENALSKGK
jgi:uncharacterized protein with FMN-binding domain